jgi:hypothetical protein
MKRLAVVVAVLLIAACTAREEAPADTAAPAMAPAPAPMPMDTGMRMDTGMMDTVTPPPATP